jgi:hypothetical protein
LYSEVIHEPDADRLAERVLRHFLDDRGTFKRTYTARFEAFDSEVTSFLQEYFPLQESFILQDVGVSDGRTACDFFERLQQKFQKITYFALDRGVRVKIIKNKYCYLALSAENKPLELTLGPFVFSLTRPWEKRDYLLYPVNIIIQKFALRFFAKKLLADYSSEKVSLSSEILLFCSRALRLVSNDTHFILNEHDILTPYAQKSHVIRAMNLLNPSYFSKEQFLCILRHMHDSLFEGGVLITGSNQDANTPVQGGIYRKSSAGFEEVRRFGNGSPIAEMITNELFFF